MELQLQQLQKVLLGLPHAKLSRITVYLVVVYIAFLFSQLFWLLWPKAENQTLPLQNNYQLSQTSTVNTQAIVAQNLFGKANATVDKPKPVVTDAPQTRLNVRLTGIFAVIDNDKSGSAIIESQGKQETYSVNEPVKGTRAKVAQVLPDRVILDVSGRFETLMLDGIEYSKNVAMPIAAKENTRPVSTIAKRRVLPKELVAKREELFKDPGKLLDYIKISPFRQNGELKGYKLRAGKDPALFEKMGLRNNDLALAINGIQLTDMQQSKLAYFELRNNTSASITIERDGQILSVQFSL